MIVNRSFRVSMKVVFRGFNCSKTLARCPPPSATRTRWIIRPPILLSSRPTTLVALWKMLKVRFRFLKEDAMRIYSPLLLELYEMGAKFSQARRTASISPSSSRAIAAHATSSRRKPLKVLLIRTYCTWSLKLRTASEEKSRALTCSSSRPDKKLTRQASAKPNRLTSSQSSATWTTEGRQPYHSLQSIASRQPIACYRNFITVTASSASVPTKASPKCKWKRSKLKP